MYKPLIIKLFSIRSLRKLLLVPLLLMGHWAIAQNDSTTVEKLKEITIQASRIVGKETLSTRAVSVLEFEETQDIKQQLSLQDYIKNVPGLFSMNAHNFSQDLRVSIRGFGARSAFGIRGVKIVVDGIPETTPDGQGQIDNLNLSLIKRIEVIKGPAATLYGNASGGVISISTMDSFKNDFVKGGMTFGADNMQQYQLAAGIKNEKSALHIQGTRTSTDGYREQSGFKNNNLYLNFKRALNTNSGITFRLNYNNSPLAEDAGGLNLEELSENRKQARARNVDFKTKERIEQLKVGLNYSYDWNNSSFNTYGFYSTRNFEGLLPFEYGGWIDLDRMYFGIGSNITLKSTKNRSKNSLMFGYDWANQQDDRMRFYNLKGEKGEKTLDQLESFNTFGLYLLDHFQYGKIFINAGLRFDTNRLKAEDLLLSNGDQSGLIKLESFSPSLGMSLQIAPKQVLFTNYSTGFETPVLSELSANPSSEGGFNQNLKPQRAKNIEFGYRYKAAQLRTELAIYAIKTSDEIVSYELEAFPDRSFYKNAGETQRYGIELSSEMIVLKNFVVNAGYTFSDFEYRDYISDENDFSNNTLPGIPKHSASLMFNYRNSNGFKLSLSNLFIGKMYANDSNTVEERGQVISTINAGYTLKMRNLTLIPFFGVNNMFNVTYNDNIRINAFGSRYYEPAPGIQLFAGLRFEFGD